MTMLFRTLLLIAVLFSATTTNAQSESDYIRMFAENFGAESEYSVLNGRIDLLTDQYAIEVEFASKWKNSIGQALWYALNTDRQPAIILLMKSIEENHFAVKLQSTLQHASIDQIQVWIYPLDFANLDINQAFHRYQQEKLDQAGPETDFWLTTNSNKRHQRGCRNFAHSNGRFCQVNEGEAAGCCH